MWPTVSIAFALSGSRRPSYDPVNQLLAASCGLRMIASEEFMTGALSSPSPSPSTWGIAHMLRK